MTLQEQIKKYAELQAQKEALEKELAQLKPGIVEGLQELGTKLYRTEDGTAQASISTRETIKYVDEAETLKFLKKNGYSQFVTETINTKALNAEIKKGVVLTESLSPLYTKTTSYSLTVSKL